MLAILLRRWSANDILVLTLCTLDGALDELWQYAAYPWYTKYYDFNDVVLNICGAALGLFLTRRPIRATLSEAGERLAAQATWLSALTLGLAVLPLALTGFIAPYVPDPGHPATPFALVDGSMRFVLSYRADPGPWPVTDYGRVYHVLTWAEGLVAATLCWTATVWLLSQRGGSRTERRG